MLVNKRFISIKINEPQLRERNEALFILQDVSNFVSTSLELQEVLEGALAKMLEFFDFVAGRIYLMDESGDSLSLAAAKGLDTEGLQRVKINEGFTGRSARTRSFIAQHVSELGDKQRAQLLTGKGLKIIICVPLMAMSKVVGVMNLAAGRIIELDQAKIDLLISVGNLIAIAVNNAILYADLKKKVKELKTQKEAIEFFAYSISHDLKSPAVGIYGLTSRLFRDYQHCLDDKGKLYCTQLLKASEQIANLVDKINLYIAAKQAPLHFERIKIIEILELLKEEFAEDLNQRGIEWSTPAEIPPMVADKLSMIRVLRNLVGNALKHGGEGLTQIRIEYDEGESHHILRVRDNGIALNGEECEKLFELFYRHERSRRVEGTGLGLAIVKELIERHHGRAWIEPGRGMTFCVSISKSLP
jgi:signal transduction histidine kinase